MNGRSSYGDQLRNNGSRRSQKIGDDDHQGPQGGLWAFLDNNLNLYLRICQPPAHNRRVAAVCGPSRLPVNTWTPLCSIYGPRPQKARRYHRRVACNKCYLQSLRIYFHCRQCRDYDLCSACFAKGVSQEGNHRFDMFDSWFLNAPMAENARPGAQVHSFPLGEFGGPYYEPRSGEVPVGIGDHGAERVRAEARRREQEANRPQQGQAVRIRPNTGRRVSPTNPIVQQTEQRETNPNLELPGDDASLTDLVEAYLRQSNLQQRTVERMEQTRRWEIPSEQALEFQRIEFAKHQAAAAEHQEVATALDERILAMLGPDSGAAVRFLLHLTGDSNPEHQRARPNSGRKEQKQRDISPHRQQTLKQNDSHKDGRCSQGKKSAGKEKQMKPASGQQKWDRVSEPRRTAQPSNDDSEGISDDDAEDEDLSRMMFGAIEMEGRDKQSGHGQPSRRNSQALGNKLPVHSKQALDHQESQRPSPDQSLQNVYIANVENLHLTPDRPSVDQDGRGQKGPKENASRRVSRNYIRRKREKDHESLYNQRSPIDHTPICTICCCHQGQGKCRHVLFEEEDE